MNGVQAPSPEHTWFGPLEAPLFGAFHLPAGGRARAVAVIAPPVGLEMLIAHRSLRVLSERLAEQGIAAIRIDYRGTGDSAGAVDDSAQVASWLASIVEAVRYARRSGAENVVVVGLRLGATLAASLSSTVEGLVLWDPCETGARFLREEEMLFRAGVPAAAGRERPVGEVQGPGSSYSAETVAALSPLTTAAVLAERHGGGHQLRDGVGRVLLAMRAESSPRRSLQLVAAADGVDTVSLPGQVELFDWRALTVPLPAIERIVGWLDELLPSESAPVEPEIRRSAVVSTSSDGIVVSESVVSIGPSGLFGIVTRSERGGGDALVLSNAAPPAIHVGPARMWVEIAREHAAERGPVLRFDGRGTGESVGARDMTYPGVYTSATVDDLVEAIGAARALGANRIAVAGLCAAAWSSLRAADIEPVDAVLAVNPSIWDVHPAGTLTGPWPPPREFPTPGPAPAVVRRARRRSRHWARSTARLALPESVWWRLAHRGLIEAPSGLITPLVRRGVRVIVLLGVREAARFASLRGGRLTSRRDGLSLLSVATVDEIDHALMSKEARRLVRVALNGW